MAYLTSGNCSRVEELPYNVADDTFSAGVTLILDVICSGITAFVLVFNVTEKLQGNKNVQGYFHNLFIIKH